jgi:hypothetical protein
VHFSTEIHPPRALVTFRLNHPALDSFVVPRTSAPNFPFPQSYLPVTGEPVDPATLPPGVSNSGPTNVPVTEADIFISVNGGAASDICTIVPVPCSTFGGHTGPIIPVNDRNYVFDIYPPGTNYSLKNGGHLVNGTFPVTPPVPDASLQWRVVDHFSELPAHACGDNEVNTYQQFLSVCKTVDPIFCLIDASTPPPDQTETGCPAAPAQPTRLRVILPFAATPNANFFAQSILLGWDDVPRPRAGSILPPANTNVSGQSTLLGPAGLPGPVNTPAVRSFKVTLHAFTVVQNGEGNPLLGGHRFGDWRVFVNVGGQYRYISPLFETDDGNIHLFSDAENFCHGTALTENGNGDCFVFDNTPWKVSVQDGTPIHVAVGGFVARGPEDSGSALFLCRTYHDYPAGCDTPTDFSIFKDPFLSLAFENDDRIGTYEFDLVRPDYSPPAPFQTAQFACTIHLEAGQCALQYTVEFRVQEIPPAAAPTSASLGIGAPHFGQFVSSATPLTLSSTAPDAQGFQYRFHLQGGPLPIYPSTQPFPVHWTDAGFPISRGPHILRVFLSGTNIADGPYFLQYSAQSFAQLLEPRHTESLILDNTPPAITVVQPQATTYTHSAVLTLGYTVDDGAGSGVASFTPALDGATTLPGGVGLQSGQPIGLLTELPLGTHTFSVNAVDNVGNADATSVTFTIIVTPDSIKDDVTQFLQSGAIKHSGLANSLLAKLAAAAAARAGGRCSRAARIYQAFINQLDARSGNGVDAVAAAIMIADARYLIAHCP